MGAGNLLHRHRLFNAQQVRGGIGVDLVLQRVARHAHADRQRVHTTRVFVACVVDRIGHTQSLLAGWKGLISAIGRTAGN